MAPKRNLHFDSSSHCFSSGIQCKFLFCQSMFFKIKKISCLIDAKYIIWTSFVSLFFVKHTYIKSSIIFKTSVIL